ncbi:MAG: alpha/beta hydrolase [Burkholderiaceae bacterium]|jgi:non-heme chloroperoxidase|nr:alpha/beta hydrolase [Burkholderiaceae bacterium]MEB2320487.1 alpha/beta fold hydrolase [Pseudomonadota bacterium]
MKPENAGVQTLMIDDGRGPALELIHIPAGGPVHAQRGDPILMIHGAYTDAWSWAPSFLPFFAARGHDVYALSLRGHGASEGKAAINAWGLADYMKDMMRAQAHIGATPILFGASMGGLLVQRWLTTGREATAVVTIGSVPPSGMTGAILRMAWTQPRNLYEIAQVAGSGTASRRFMHMLVEQPLRAGEADFYRRHLARESSRALWELTWMPMVMPTRPSCPVLATHGELDRMVPPDSLDVIERYFGAERMVFEAMGHCPMLEKRWEEAAGRIAAWLDERLYSEIDDEQLD